MHSTIKVGLVYGSTRKGRFCDVVANWAAQQVAASAKFTLRSIDPSEAQLSPTIQERIGASDAFVVVTPEYNHGYPAPLKAMIDSVSAEWHAKPVAFVSYGGISGGLRTVEQLRQVFAEMHAVTVRDTVSFASAWEQFDPTGQLLNPARAERSMKVMLARLHWWATALRTAREATPFLNAA
jgi:NAD(P)H-dependent FMN reductase